MLAKLTGHATLLVTFIVGLAILGIAVSARAADPPDHPWVVARQLYGLGAFGCLLAASLIGPLASVLPRLPGRSFLLAARRAVGVASFAFAVVHAASYVLPTLAASWRDFFSPGGLWVTGISLGALASVDLLVLSWTSRDAAIKRLGGKRWKRLHRTVHLVLPVVFLHAVLVGADFGLAPGIPSAERDFGSLVGFGLMLAVWATLMELRRRSLRFPAART